LASQKGCMTAVQFLFITGKYSDIVTLTGVQVDVNLLHLKCINTLIYNNETINTYTLK
jgi:hypothetical protein